MPSARSTGLSKTGASRAAEPGPRAPPTMTARPPCQGTARSAVAPRVHWEPSRPEPLTRSAHLHARRSRRLAGQSLQDRLEATAEVAAVAAAVAAAEHNRPPPLSAPTPPPPAGPDSAPAQALPAPAPTAVVPAPPPPAGPAALQPLPAFPVPSVPLQPPLQSPPLPPPAPSPPPRPPWPPAAPYQWVPMDATQRRRADTLITIFENASLEPQCEHGPVAHAAALTGLMCWRCRVGRGWQRLGGGAQQLGVAGCRF